MTPVPPGAIFWGIEWRSDNVLDGRQRYLVWDREIRLFRTRGEARAHIELRYGYIRRRPDLRSEPHDWRMPVAARVEVRRVR